MVDNTRDVDHKTDTDKNCAIIRLIRISTVQISHQRFMTKMPNCLRGKTYSLQLMLYPVNSLETSTFNDQEMVSGDKYM